MSDNGPAVTGQLMFGVFMGAIAMAAVNMALTDWKGRADMYEEARCLDEPDTKAYMARLPGEAHTVEHCIHAMRIGSPRWIPDFQSPLKPERGQ